MRYVPLFLNLCSSESERPNLHNPPERRSRYKDQLKRPKQWHEDQQPCNLEQRYACPQAANFQCKDTFADLGGARRHAETVHRNALGWPCPDAEKCACDRIFSSQDLANR